MEMEIITFEKTFKQRLEEYKNLLCSDEVLPASEMRSEWSYITEQIVEPVGWKALWKIPANKQEELGIVCPTVALVLVESVNANDLTVDVTVLSVEDKSVPKQLMVFLVDLYPTLQQINEELNVKQTADFIDKLRFFYHCLWMPWDVDDDENQSWTSAHLEPRLKLYFNMQNGSIPFEMCIQIQYLISEGRRIQSEIAESEEKVEDDMNDEAIMCNLMELHYRKDQLKNKFEMYEDPYKRSLLIWKQCHKTAGKIESTDRQEVTYIVWSDGSMNSYLKFLNEAKSHVIDSDFVKTSFQLQESLNEAACGDKILLAEGCYGLGGLSGIERGGTIKGVGSSESTILKPHNAGNVILDCNGGVVTLENLTIDIEKAQIAVLVRNATLHLRNCRIVGRKGNSNTGVLVLSGGSVVAQNCVLCSLGSALVVCPKGEVSLISSKIENCRVGMKIQDDAKINLMKCDISECLEFGIRVEISRKVMSSDAEVGSAVLLSSVGEIQLSDTKIKNNIRGDVCILQRNNGIPDGIESPSFSFLLFNNPPVITTSKHDDDTDKGHS